MISIACVHSLFSVVYVVRVALNLPSGGLDDGDDNFTSSAPRGSNRISSQRKILRLREFGMRNEFEDALFCCGLVVGTD